MGPRGLEVGALDCNFSSLIFPFGMCLDPVVCVIRPSERPSGNLEFGNKSRFPVFFPNTVEPEFDGHMSSKEESVCCRRRRHHHNNPFFIWNCRNFTLFSISRSQLTGVNECVVFLFLWWTMVWFVPAGLHSPGWTPISMDFSFPFN